LPRRDIVGVNRSLEASGATCMHLTIGRFDDLRAARCAGVRFGFVPGNKISADGLISLRRHSKVSGYATAIA
jgi:hypothetical protein